MIKTQFTLPKVQRSQVRSAIPTKKKRKTLENVSLYFKYQKNPPIYLTLSPEFVSSSGNSYRKEKGREKTKKKPKEKRDTELVNLDKVKKKRKNR